jgi:hypothetical protein
MRIRFAFWIAGFGLKAVLVVVHNSFAEFNGIKTVWLAGALQALNGQTLTHASI